MADKKISALTAATTPLAGTEVLPIVQSGSTVKVSVDNLTTGKIVYGLRFAGNISNPNSYAFNGDTNVVAGDAAGNATWTLVSSSTGIGYLSFADGTSGVARYAGRVDYNHSTNSMGFYTNGGVEAQVIDSSQNVKVSAGNLVVGTAAKGIDFSANTGAAGETSALLNWYEEGTWTPSMTFATVGDFALGTPIVQTGKYTRVGRMVTCNFTLVTTPTWTTSSGYLKLTGLPFTTASGAASGYGCATFVNVTKAGYTNYTWETEPANTFAYLTASSNGGSAGASIVASEMTSGVQTVLAGSIVYFV